MERAQKDQIVQQVRDEFTNMSSAVFVDYVGMSVEQVSQLRASFREKGVKYRVVKNTLVKKAIEDLEWSGQVADSLRGMTGIAWSYEEPSAAARILKAFRADGDKPVIKAGVMDGQLIDARGVESQLATLPSKDEARATLLATLMAPAQNFVRLLNAPAQNFVGVVAAKQRKDEGG